MDQVAEFFKGLLDTSDWPARWFCGRWTEFHGWLYIISDLTIWMAYFAIPVFLLMFVAKKKDVPLPRVFWLFGAFILACGSTHLIDAIIFWWPAYRLSALLRFFTAIVSVATVIALFKFFPKALTLTTSAEFNREIAKRKKIEKQLKKANESLAQKNKEIEEFAFMVSHDLQEPVRTIKSMLEISEQDLQPHFNEENRTMFNFMGNAANRMQNMIADLLAYSRVGQNKEKKSVDLNKLVNNVQNDLSKRIKETGTVINVQELPTIQGYEQELYMLFQNILTNAIKFVAPGTTPLINIEVTENISSWEFSINDNGIGIPASEMEKVFVIFKQLNNRDDYEGSGIGLAHCKKIVELHNGTIWIESEPGNGSTFYFTLPKNL